MSSFCGLLSGCFGGASEGLTKQVIPATQDQDLKLNEQVVSRLDSAQEDGLPRKLPGATVPLPVDGGDVEIIKAAPSPSAPASAAPPPPSHHLRRILSHARSQTSACSISSAVSGPIASTVPEGQAYLNELYTHITACLAEANNNLDALTSHLDHARHWLSKDGTITGADALLKLLAGAMQSVETHLLHLELHQWTPGTMSASLALMHLYNDLVKHAMNPRPHAKALRTTLTHHLLTRPQPLMLWSRMQQHASANTSSGPDAKLICWELLNSMLRVLGMAPKAQPVQGSDPDPGAPHVQLTDCSTSSECHAWSGELSRLVSSPAGPLAHVLHLPFTMHSAAAQLAVLKTLKTLYALQGSGHVSQDVASMFASSHFCQFQQYYLLSGSDASSAAAELAGVHLEVLLAAVATRSLAVRHQLSQQGAVEQLLEHFSVEAQLLSEELARLAQEQEEAAEGSSGSSSEDEAASPGSGAARSHHHLHGNRSHEQGLTGSHTEGGAATTGFSFTWDLNEDFERLIAFEEETGQTVKLPGLEYDDEALHIMARSALRPVVPQPPPRSPRALPPTLTPLKLNLPSPSIHSRSSRGSDASHLGPTMSRQTPPEASRLGSKPTVPRLALGSLRSAASSRMVTPTPHRQDPFNSARSLHRDALLTSGRLHSDAAGPDARLRDWSSQAGALGLGVPPASSTPPSARLYHSHLSPLSTQRSVPSPTTRLSLQPQPSLMTPTRSTRLRLTTSLSQQHPLDAEGQAQAGHLHQVHSAQGPSEQQAEAGGAGAEDDEDQYDRQVTCAAFLHQPHTHQEAVTVRAEMHDAVPDLQPWPPLQPHGAGPAGQAGRGLGNRPVPSLNLKCLSARGTDGQALDSKASQESVLLTGATMTDSAMNPNHARPSLGYASSRTSRQHAASDASPKGQLLPGGPVSCQSAYQQAVQARLWYHDPALHASMLFLLFDLLLLPTGSLDPTYMQPFPGEAGRLNVEHVLAWHFTGPAGVAILPHLLNVFAARARSNPSPSGAQATSSPHSSLISSCIRLLRLLSRQLFDPCVYQDLVFHSRGAYGAIYRAKLHDPATGTTQQVMVKAIDLPSTGFDRCVLPDVFGEVTILDKYALHPSLPALLTSATSQLSTPFTGSGFKPVPDLALCVPSGQLTEQRKQALQSICQLRDYGLTQGSYWLVMHRYRCSLAEWRSRQPSAQGPAAIAMYLAVLLQIIDAMMMLALDSVVHFDLKAANVLVQPLDGVKDGQLYGPPPPPPCRPPFTAVLADFGEARAYRNAEEAYTARNRGTEVYKSPEMLMMHSMPPSQACSGPGDHQDASMKTRSIRQGGAGLASDMWSFGCLTYELLSGRTLFNESDYASVTHRVVFGSGPHLTLTPVEVEGLGTYGPSHLQALVEGILVRDHTARPTPLAIQERLQHVREEMLLLAGGQAGGPPTPPA